MAEQNETGEAIQVNPFEIIGKMYVDAEILRHKLTVLAQGYQQQAGEIMELRLQLEELKPKDQAPESNGKKENAQDILEKLA